MWGNERIWKANTTVELITLNVFRPCFEQGFAYDENSTDFTFVRGLGSVVMDARFRATNDALCDVDIDFTLEVFGYNGAQLAFNDDQIRLYDSGAVLVMGLPLGRYSIQIHATSWIFTEDVTLTLTVLETSDAPIIEETARNALTPAFGEVLLYHGYTKFVDIEDIGFDTDQPITVFEDVGGLAIILTDNMSRRNQLMVSSDGTEKIGRHQILLQQNDLLILINILVAVKPDGAETNPAETGYLTDFANHWITNPDYYPQPITADQVQIELEYVTQNGELLIRFGPELREIDPTQVDSSVIQLRINDDSWLGRSVNDGDAKRRLDEDDATDDVRYFEWSVE